VSRGVPWGKDGLKRAYAVAIHDEPSRTGFRAGEPHQLLSGFARIERKIASEKAGFSMSDYELDFGKLLNESVERSYVIDVRVCKGDMPDRGIQMLRSTEYLGRRASEVGVNKGEPIVFPDQEAVNHSKACQPKQTLGFLGEFHTGTGEIRAWLPARTWELARLFRVGRFFRGGRDRR